MLDYRKLVSALRRLDLRSRPVIAHAALSKFGRVNGGAETLLGALLDSVGALVVPTFTYKTMVTPEVGPPNNGMTYGKDLDQNLMAQPFTPDMPADPLMGVLPETVRRHPRARRTSHPILSFAGIRADEFLEAQTLFNPLAPIGALADAGGWVLLLGVDHTVNTSIHYGEKLAGRMQFTRWALTLTRVRECPGFPGCSAGFNAIQPDIVRETRVAQVGEAQVQAIPLKELLQAVMARIRRDPLALLCDEPDCPRCNAVRAAQSQAI